MTMFDTYWNSPEGCLSIATEDIGQGTLSDMTDCVGMVPESALQELASQLAESIHTIHHTCYENSSEILQPGAIRFSLRGDHAHVRLCINAG